jgi:hypothetical protein
LSRSTCGTLSALTLSAPRIPECASAGDRGIESRGSVDLLRFSLHRLPVHLTVHHLRAKVRNLLRDIGMFCETVSDDLALPICDFGKIEAAAATSLRVLPALLCSTCLTRRRSGALCATLSSATASAAL